MVNEGDDDGSREEDDGDEKEEEEEEEEDEIRDGTERGDASAASRSISAICGAISRYSNASDVRALVASFGRFFGDAVVAATTVATVVAATMAATATVAVLAGAGFFDVTRVGGRDGVRNGAGGVGKATAAAAVARDLRFVP